MRTGIQITHGLALLLALTLTAALAGCTSQTPLPNATAPTPVSDAVVQQAVTPPTESTAPDSIATRVNKNTLTASDAPSSQPPVTAIAAPHTTAAPQQTQALDNNTPQLPVAVLTGHSADGNPTATDTDATASKTTPLHFKKAHSLEPFHASFRIYVSKIPMPITAKLDLAPTGKPDTWKMRFKVNSFLLSNLEESTFTWNNCKPKSIHYRHDFKGFGKHQFHDTSFYWNPPHVVNHSDEDNKEFSIPADSVDDLTVLLQAACVLSEGAKDYYATSIYGDDIRDNHFKLLRHDTIDTPLGKLDTLVIEKVRGKKSSRKTLFWIAPKLNYMLVKAKHIESSLLFGEVIMTDYHGPHKNP